MTAPSVPPRDLNRPVVCVDLDKTLISYESWQGPKHFGNILGDPTRALQALKLNGFDIHILTARDVRPVIAWLRGTDLAPYITSVTNKKPKGHVAIFDDCAVRVEPNTPGALLTSVTAWLHTERVGMPTTNDQQGVGPQ